MSPRAAARALLGCAAAQKRGSERTDGRRASGDGSALLSIDVLSVWRGPLGERSGSWARHGSPAAYGSCSAFSLRCGGPGSCGPNATAMRRQRSAASIAAAGAILQPYRLQYVHAVRCGRRPGRVVSCLRCAGWGAGGVSGGRRGGRWRAMEGWRGLQQASGAGQRRWMTHRPSAHEEARYAHRRLARATRAIQACTAAARRQGKAMADSRLQIAYRVPQTADCRLRARATASATTSPDQAGMRRAAC